MKKILSFFSMALVAIFTLSCADDDLGGNGPLTLHFDNVVGNANLQLNTEDELYTNSKSESYKVTSLIYYVSDIVLKKSDGTIYTAPVKSDGSMGYYLIDERDEASQDVTLLDIPSGDYTEVTFTVGVNAVQVDQGAQTGALDPAKGLFWSWNSGYIFMAIEGVSTVSTEADHVFQYHVGGYKDDAASNQVNNIKTITLGFNGDSAPVRPQHEPEVHILFDVNRFLNGVGEQVTFSASASRHSPKTCKDLARNIVDAYVVDHVHAN